MNRFLLAILTGFLMAGTICIADEPKIDRQDEEIIALVLKSNFGIYAERKNMYVVVKPETEPIEKIGRKSEERIKYCMSNKSIIEGYDPSALIIQLYEKNMTDKKLRLSLKSDPKNGYIIDYDGKYINYFRNKGDGWKKWYEENPKAYGYATISLPAWDHKSNYILVYVSLKIGILSGRGDIIVYKYENGDLIKICSVMLWIS